jgi:S1-C subfamily serine protease
MTWASSPSESLPPPGAPALVAGEDEKNNIDIYQKYSPGVVNITTTTLTYDFFLRPVPTESGSGSGAIIDAQGHIVTNFHVIEGARRLEVTLSDKTKHPARVVGFDESNDLAIIKIEPNGRPLVTVPLGASKDLQVGQKVLAIGNPYGLEGTLTTGIISSNDLITLGYVRRPYLGITNNAIPLQEFPGLANRLRIDTDDQGLLVVNVGRNSPADRAGIRGATQAIVIGNYEVPAGGDVILAIEGKPVNDWQQLALEIDRYKPGDTVKVTILRDNQKRDISVTLQELPRQQRQ